MGENNTGSIIAGGAALLGQGINWASQGSMNKKTRKWNEEMYEKQRANALSDWNMQNAYNSPEAQMARYKAAGLNPHLIYGQSNTSQPVRSTEQKSWSPEAPRFDPGAVTGAYLDAQIRTAQINNMAVQASVMDADRRLKEAQIGAVIANTDSTNWKTGYAQSIADISTDFLRQKVNHEVASTNMLMDENTRREAMMQPNLRLAAIKVLQGQLNLTKTAVETDRIRQNISNLRQDARLKTFEEELNKYGMTKGDPLWSRAINYLVGQGKLPSPAEFKNWVNENVERGVDKFRKYSDSTGVNLRNRLHRANQ